MKSTRSQSRGSPQAFWNVLLLSVHMAFHSAHETQDCFQWQKLGAKRALCCKGLRLMKLVNQSCFHDSSWQVGKAQVFPALTTYRAETCFQILLARCRLPACLWGPANLIPYLNYVTIWIINLFKWKVKQETLTYLHLYAFIYMYRCIDIRSIYTHIYK